MSRTVHERRRPGLERVAASAGSLAFAAIAAPCLLAAVAYTGLRGEAYSPLNHWISELGQPGVSRYASVVNPALVLAGLAFLVFVAGLALTSPSRLRWLFGPIGALAGIGGSLVGIFPMDHPNEHVAAASVFFELGWVFVALASVTFVRARDARFPPWLAGVGAIDAVASIAFLVALRVDAFSQERMATDGPITGRPDVWIAPILEWATLIGIMAWVLLTSLAWLRQLRREEVTGAVAVGRTA
ncbi:MAG TPA: DUF998 domain-containing protein [Candidatus Limnocylindrales bacterium]